MSRRNDLVDDLAGVEEDSPEEYLADLWILLGARSGSFSAGTAILALADSDVAVRAMCHLASPRNDRLADASRGFLRNLVAHSSAREVEAWLSASRRAFGAAGDQTDPEDIIAQLGGVPSDSSTELGVIVTPSGSGKTQFVLQFLAAHLSPDETLTAAAELASLHPDLEREESASIRSLLATVVVRDRLIEHLAGDPRQVVGAEDVADSLLRQARIVGEAMASIWEYPMLEPRAAAVALGAKPTNREKVRIYRDRSWLLGLPRGRGYLYPRFQFDHESRDLYVEVKSTNELLRAADDPWGVASWWTAQNDRIDARPVELVGTARAPEIAHAAHAVLEPVG